MWEAIPSVVAAILTIVLWSIVGMLEGMQIAFFAVSKLTEEERNKSVWAKRTCELLFKGEGHNLPGFMVGRQLCVVSCFFFAARATSLEIADDEENVLGVPDGVQEFFNTGLLGALITTIIASIAWQLVASAFPMAFLSTPITYILLRICLALEATGICQGAWVLASIHKSIAGFQKDEVYVGTAEDRLAGKIRPGAYRSEVGHLTGGAFPANKSLLLPDEWEAPLVDRRAKVLTNIKNLRDLMKMSPSEDEIAVYENALAQEVAALDRINKEHGNMAVEYKKQQSTDLGKADDDMENAPVDDEGHEISTKMSEDFI